MLWAAIFPNARSSKSLLAASRSVAASCFDLIGLRYRLGADGSNGEIDCIHLVVTVLDRMGIPRPAITQQMYEADGRRIARWLFEWGVRVTQASYDGDVLLLPADNRAFGIVWNGGILSIEQLSETVQWSPLRNWCACPCFRTKDN